MFIEVSEVDGKRIAINTEFIQEVESTTDGVVVHTARGSYHSSFPYGLFIQLISKEEQEEVKEVKLQPDAMNALNSLGHHFAG